MKSNNKALRELSKTAAKGVFGGIPYIGALLDEIIFEHRSRLKQERLNNFILKLEEYFLTRADNSHPIGATSFQSEEFSDIFESILYGVAKTSAEHKLEIFRNILVRHLEANNTSPDMENTYINITNALSEIQFLILKHFASVSDEDLFIPVYFEQLRFRRGISNFNLPGFSAENERKRMRLRYERWEQIEDPNKNSTYGITMELFLINTTDLISKGLLFDFIYVDEIMEQNKYFGISVLGRSYIEYVVNA